MSNSIADGGGGEGGGGGGGGEIVLLGVRVVVGDLMRKCVSLNDLSEYEQPHEDQAKGEGQERETKKGRIDDVVVGAGYASADEVVPRCNNPGTRARKRGVPWTEDEHKLFLLGLQKAGKGDWRGISKNFVKTRTPTQVASHAQKYFLRRTNLNRRRRRSSLFDITTTDSVAAMEEEQSTNQDKTATLMEMVPPAMVAPAIPPVMLTLPLTKSFGSPTLEPVGSVKVALTSIICPIPVVQAPSASASPLFDLNLSLTSPTAQPTSLEPATIWRSDLGDPSRGPSSAFHTMPLSFSGRDSSNSSIISVA